MLKKYWIIFSFQIAANTLWVFWALPQIGEEASLVHSLEWLGTQILFPIFFSLLISQRRKSGFWLVVVYGAFTGLYGLGTFAWAVIGTYTPASVYVVSGLFIVIAFTLIFAALKDLNIGKTRRRYDIEG